MFRRRSARYMRKKNPPPDDTRIRELNRLAFEEVAPIHAASQWVRLERSFREPGYSCLGAFREGILKAHGLEGRSVVHPCCNNGRELLSMKNLGAGRCLGFDFSAAFIEQGRQLAEVAGLDCELLQGEVSDFPSSYDGQFDIATITPGSLRCLPDPREMFALVHRLLRPGGWMFVYEMHPAVDVYGMESAQRPTRQRLSYFDRGAHRTTRGLDYFRVKGYRGRVSYQYHHTMSDVLQACLDSGLALQTFEELPHEMSGGRFASLERRGWIPLSYTLTAERPGS